MDRPPDSPPDPLQQAYEIAAGVQHLRSLLHLQLRALLSLEDRLYVGASGSVAARRLAALKHEGRPRVRGPVRPLP
jgi:hypothetical protein